MLRALAATPAVALPLALLFWLSGEVSPLAAAAALAVFALVVFCAGFLLLRAAGAGDLGAAAAWVLGILATAVALTVLVMAFKLLAATAFALWAAAVLAGAAYWRDGARAGRAEVLSLLLCGAVTAYWCWDIAAVPEVLSREGIMTTWVDQFGHGAMISQFGDPRAAGRGSILFAGMPLWSYHYASYMLPAAFAWPLDLPGLPLATSLWTPIGFFTLCAAAYALGAALAGGMGGALAVAVLTLAPDAGSYGLHNRAFAYYWYVLAAPGAAYGVATGLLSILLLQRWAAARSPRTLAALALATAGSVLVRVHIFLLVVPTLLASLALLVPAARRRLAWVALGGGLAFAAFVFAYYRWVPGAQPALLEFLEMVRNPFHPVYHTWYAGLAERYGAPATVPAGLLLVFPAGFGVLLALYPLSVLLARRARGLQAIDAVPPVMLAAYVLLMVSAPIPPHGDASEFTQRPFVLVYAVLGVWTAAGVALWLQGLGGLQAARVRMILAAIAAAWVAGILLFTVRDTRWYLAHKIGVGVAQGAAYLRAHSRPGELVAVKGLWAGRAFMDDAVVAVSLTGIPAYLSVPFLHASRGGQQAEVKRRYDALAGVADAADARSALARLRELGVRWYVVHGGVDAEAGPRWDPQRRLAAFTGPGIAVYAATE